VVCSVAPSNRVKASANHTHEWSATQRCTVAQYCSVYPHSLQVMITLSARTSCKRLGNVQACLGNMRTLLHAVVSMLFFILKAHGPLRVARHVIAPEPLPPTPLSREAGSRAMGHVAAPEPSRIGRQGSEPCDT
jgi:hypothetical protein